jgi:4-amino-4-deoxy-L-arabinose transferase-like glycosyltransferase
MKLEKHHYLFLFIIFLFLGIVSTELFSDGMFMDGLIYADISRNMAEGLGSFWKPHFTDTLFNVFYEHPPLAFGLQSIFFKLFGDNIYIERFYSLLTYVIVGCLIVLIWSKLTSDKKTGWLPLFLWLSTNYVTWALANNMLENTMSIFVCLSVLFYLNSFDKRRFLWIALSGLSLFLGLLTKGFFCLYIWSIPFFMWIFIGKRSFSKMIIDNIIIVAFTIIPIALLFFLVPDAQNNMLNYFYKQVIGSIQNVQTVNSRFFIIGAFFESIIIPLIIGLIIIIVSLKKDRNMALFRENLSKFLMFFAIVLSGVIPIMISAKQSSFYILTVYPLFSVGLAYYLYPFINSIINNVKITPNSYVVFKKITIGIVFISITMSVTQINRIGREKNEVLASKAIIDIVGRNTTINICPEMYIIWSLHGYMSRYGNISLDENQNNKHQYYLSLENCNRQLLEDKYDLIPLKTKKYKLFKRKTTAKVKKNLTLKRYQYTR